MYRNQGQLLIFASNLNKSIPAIGKDCGLTDAEIKSITGGASGIQDAIHAEEQAKAAWRSASARTKQVKEQALPQLERLIDKMRTSTAWNAERERTLMLSPKAAQPVALEAIKPRLKLSVTGGKVRVDWTRGKLDGVNVYSRKRGEPTWRLLERDNRPPFIDNTPLSQPGVAEVREYRLSGVYRDQEVGVPSDVAAITLME